MKPNAWRLKYVGFEVLIVYDSSTDEEWSTWFTSQVDILFRWYKIYSHYEGLKLGFFDEDDKESRCCFSNYVAYLTTTS